MIAFHPEHIRGKEGDKIAMINHYLLTVYLQFTDLKWQVYILPAGSKSLKGA